MFACLLHSLVESCSAGGPVLPAPLRYEEEVALRATAENEFVALKKVSA